MKKQGRLKKFISIVALSVMGIGGLYLIYEICQVPNKIVLVSKSIQEEYVFWETIRMGAELAAKEEEVEFEYVGPLEEKDVDVQIQIMEQAIEQGADIILLAASDSEKLSDVVEEAKKEGIVVVSVDSTVKGLSHMVATNNRGAARELTNYLANLIDHEGQVIMLNFLQGTSTAKEREEGYDTEIKRYSGITRLPTMYTEGTTQSAYLKTKEIIEKYPDIKGIIGANQYMTEGICLAIEELGLAGKVKAVGFDSSSVIIEALEKGVINSIVVQKPFNMGYIGVKVAMGLFQHKKVNEYIDTGYKLITPQTLYLTENQKLLYPIIE